MTQRGNHRVSIFFSNQDRVLYVELLATHFARQRIDLIGHCLMTNHVHQLVIPRRPESLAFGIGPAPGYPSSISLNALLAILPFPGDLVGPSPYPHRR